jgi:pimeloyl-ACP methyl ester carboxylesterase
MADASSPRAQRVHTGPAELHELWRKPPRFTELGSARIAWRVAGGGEPLLLIHGWPLSSWSFRRILPRLAEHFTCYLPDTPGLGESEWREATDFRFAGQAETLRRFADAQGLGAFSVLAFDTGATLARQLALIDPARVRRLVLLNTEIPGHRPPFIPLFQRTLRLPGSAAAMRVLLRSRALRRSRIGFGGCFVDLDLLDGEFHEGHVAPLLGSARRLEGARRYLSGIDWALVDGLAERHHEIAAPVLFVWGEDDPTFPIERARAMPAQLPRCHGLVPIARARLLVHEEQPAAVVDAALPFLLGRA